METVGVLFTFFTYSIEGVFAFDSCYYGNGFTDFEKCHNGCCGSTKGDVCCMAVGMIIGIVIGCIVLVILIASLICCICFPKKKRSVGIIHANPRSTFTVQTGTAVRIGPHAPTGYTVMPGSSGMNGPPMIQGPPIHQGHQGYKTGPPTHGPPGAFSQSAYPPKPPPAQQSGFTYSGGPVPTAPPPSYDLVGPPPSEAVYNKPTANS